MGIFGGPCKHLVDYQKESLSLSGFSGPDKVNVKFGDLKIDPKVMQTAAEITQLYDAMQYSDCMRIEQLPKNSPDRVKLTHEVLENEHQIVQLALLIKVLALSPNSEKLQQAIVDWIAAQANRMSHSPEMTPKVLRVATKTLTVTGVRSSIRATADTVPALKSALATHKTFNFKSYLE